MLKRSYKLIICVVLIATLFIGFGSAFATAAEPVWLFRMKAAVAAALLAGQLVINPVDVILNEPIASGVDPLGQLPWVETLPEYLDRSTIEVIADSVFIDGEYYSQIWIGPDAAHSLRLKGLDFETAYNILSNQSEDITYAEGVGYIAGVPAYRVGSEIRTATVNVPAGSSALEMSDLLSVYGNPRPNFPDYTLFGYNYSGSNVQLNTNSRSSNLFFPASVYFLQSGAKWKLSADSSWTVSPRVFPYVESPFSFDYTSGVIDAPISEDDGLLITIPSQYTDPQNPQYNYDIHDLINIYPTVTQPGGHEINIDPELNPDFQTDIDLGNGIGDLIRIIISLIDLLDNIEVEFAPEPEQPQPGPVDPDPAEPDVPVGEQDGTWLDELLRWIKNAIDTISQTIIDAKDAIQNEIQDLSQTISELPQQILEDIETGPSKVFRKAIDVLKSLFMPLLLPIKAMMGLWHYVVEWIGSVTSPFTWIFGIMSNANYNMVLPIYATLAGSICIAIYKALGR